MTADPRGDLRSIVRAQLRIGRDRASSDPEGEIMRAADWYANAIAEQAIDVLVNDPGKLAARQRLAKATSERTGRTP